MLARTMGNLDALEKVKVLHRAAVDKVKTHTEDEKERIWRG